jgi:integrase
MPMAQVLVHHRNVKITIYPWRDGHRFAYYDAAGRRRYTTRRNLADAKAAALAHARTVAARTAALDALTPDQRRILADLLAADPTLAAARQFLATRPAPVTVADAAARFLAGKRSANPKSRYNADKLATYVSRLPQQMPVHDIAPAHVEAAMTGAPRSRLNAHRGIRTFLRWCQRAGHLPDGPTAADRIDAPAAPAGTPAILTPDELHLVLAAAPPPCLPWLALGAWAGVRTEELYRERHPLQWEDIDMAGCIMTIRPETSKVSRRRIVPILPPLAAALRAIGPAAGRIAPPGDGPTKGQLRAIGEPIGGWRRNALRHSFLTYRSAQVGTGQAALEAGNSEAITRRNYLDATTPAEAARWFSVPQMFRTFADTPQNATSQDPRKSKDSRRGRGAE